MMTTTPSGKYFPVTATPEQNVKISQALSGTDDLFYGFIIVVDDDIATVAWNMDGMPYGVEYRAELRNHFINLIQSLNADQIIDLAIYTINVHMEGLDHI